MRLTQDDEPILFLRMQRVVNRQCERSEKTVLASSKERPCLRMLLLAFCSSHSNARLIACVSCGPHYTRFLISCIFSPRPRISLVRTSKLAGVPASRVFSPLTMDS